MSTATATREPRTATAMLFSTDAIIRELTPTKRFAKNDAGATVLILEDVPVFRSGTFRDSMGFQSTWEGIHIDQMTAHFDMLKSRNIFGDVPVRSGHPGFLVSGTEGTGKVVGWHTGLRSERRTSNHDGKEYDYLLASYEIIDPEAQQAINSGLWRNRSAEVGTFVTNDEAEFWPVYQGVAYVDIPAVEGLNAFSRQHHVSFMMEEGSMTTTADGTSTTTATTPPAPPVPPAAPAAPVTPAPVAQHAAPTQVHAFTINGEAVSDFGRVQEYINSVTAEVAGLRQFRTETIEAGRAAFVSSLASTNRILATQVESLTAFAKGLNDEQFATWSKAYEDVQPSPILGQYGSPASTEGQHSQPVGGEVDRQADDLMVARTIVANHKRAGMHPDQIKATPSYAKVIAADPSFKL